MFTVTFQLGSFGTQTVEVTTGERGEEVPEIPELPVAEVLGWYDEDGVEVDPAKVTVTEDMVFTARWERQVEDLLDTDTHSAYLNGYDNGTLLPDREVTRGEAAQMFYNLLRDKELEGKAFSDVDPALWYGEPIGAMAALGVIGGYEDGTFRPEQPITRAEFVKMAVACDTLSAGEASFTDVPEGYWAEDYIATAVEAGWIDGYGGSVFKPEGKITRVEAVKILNRMLGRHPDPAVKEYQVTNFYDVYPEHWGYGEIAEASTTHTPDLTGEQEVWADYVKDTTAESGRWVTIGGERYYIDPVSRKFLRGKQTIGGEKYLLDAATGAAVTGFALDGTWKRYYLNGLLQDDISDLGVVSGPYYIVVDKPSNYLIIYAKDENGTYNIPVKAMLVSCGYGTPTGVYYTPYRYRWLEMVGNTWAQWCTQIQGNYLFHSVPNWTYNNLDLEVEEFNHLGETRSLGCIRLCCEDAKWIYDNCVLGTKVYISPSKLSSPLEKPTGIKLPYWHTWDPTDPTAYYMCQRNGCH